MFTNLISESNISLAKVNLLSFLTIILTQHLKVNYLQSNIGLLELCFDIFLRSFRLLGLAVDNANALVCMFLIPYLTIPYFSMSALNPVLPILLNQTVYYHF